MSLFSVSYILQPVKDYLFAIFILHSRESELYRYTLDGKSALAWELPFSRFMGHLSPVYGSQLGKHCEDMEYLAMLKNIIGRVESQLQRLIS